MSNSEQPLVKKLMRLPPRAPYAPHVAGPRPDHWHEMELTRYFENAFRNRMSTLNRQPMAVRSLSLINDLLARLSGVGNVQHQISHQLCLKARGGYMSACEHALAGQVADVHPLVRSALEHVAVAADLFFHPDHLEIWLNRHRDEEARAAARKIGSHRVLRDAVGEADKDVVALWEALYDLTIDHGAHPNVQGLDINAQAVDLPDGGVVLHQVFLHAEGPIMETALCVVEDAGACMLSIASSLFPDRFSDKERAKLKASAVAITARAQRRFDHFRFTGEDVTGREP